MVFKIALDESLDTIGHQGYTVMLCRDLQVSCVFSVYFFNFRPTFFFCVGTGFVIVAVYVYSKFPYKTRYVPPVVNGETELDEKVDLVKEKDKDGKSGT